MLQLTKNFARVTPYYAHHLALGAKMMEKGGWIRPSLFTSVEDEVRNTRNHVGIIDVHSMGKFEVIGKDAFAFMQYAMTNDLNRIKKGKQGIYTCLCNDEGGIVDDVVVYYISDERFYFITNTVSRDRVGPWLNELLHRTGYRAEVIDVTNATAYLAIQGPKSRQLALDLFGAEAGELAYFEFSNVMLANIPVLLARTGYTGELGYELNFPSEYAYQMWEHVMEVGQRYSIKPVGGIAIQVMRSEKAYRSHGTDMTEQNNPYEVGLQWTVRLNKGEFSGKEALQQFKENGTSQTLKGFIVRGGDPLTKGTKLLVQGQEAGVITTCYESPTLGYTIAMGMVHTSFQSENYFTVDASNAIVQVTSMPFYDPKGERTRA